MMDASGIYFDGTFGRGGHSKAILQKLSVNGKLIGFDKDPQAIQVGAALSEVEPRFQIVHNSFARLDEVARQQQVYGQVAGVLLDLGVSSPQLDDAERGFSFQKDGPLDMRMDSTSGLSAAQWIAQVSEGELVRVLKEYGEERFAKRIARAICGRRQEKPFTRTADLAQVISAANPKWEREKHPATRSFQAIRIAVNQELDDLVLGLEKALDVLRPGGRLVVISFHSLEDRIVKRFFKQQAMGTQYPKHLPITEDMNDQTLSLVGKAVKPSETELAQNIRSRSAVLRVAEKL